MSLAASVVAASGDAPGPHGHTGGAHNGGGGGGVNEVELMRTILGDSVPQSLILACLNACAFDVSAALNWYFMEIAAHEDEDAEASRTAAVTTDDAALLRGTALDASVAGLHSVPVIQSGLSLTLHPRHLSGMVSKTDTYYATLTRGAAAYDMLTPSNEKFLTIRLRKRNWPTGHLMMNPQGPGSFLSSPQHGQWSSTLDGRPHGPTAAAGLQRPYFTNGDIVSLECNGLWLKASSYHKMLQWKAPSEDDRCKFVIRGLPLGRNLRPGDYFFLTSYKYEDKEIVMKEEKPVGVTSYNTSVHRCFLGLDRVKTPSQRLYLYAKLTDNAISSLPHPDDPIDVRHLSINIVSTSTIPDERPQLPRQESISEEIYQIDAKIDQMVDIVGDDVSRDRLANFLDGAGGDVQIALEHYFMTLSTIEPPASAERHSVLRTTEVLSTPDSQAHLQAAHGLHHRRPLSELIIPIPSIADSLDAPSPVQDSAPPLPSDAATDSFVNAALEAELLSTTRTRSAGSRDNITLEPCDPLQPVEPEGLTIQDFEMISVLGKGSFGAVMLVRFKKDGRVFALKIIKKSNMDKADIRNAMEERQILQRIHHPYICSLVFAFQTNERLYLGMKYYAAGDLFYHLNMRGQLPLRDAQLYGAELVSAISYLHELNILYRDLKPSNVMIDSEGHIGVVDFGLSKQHIYGSSHGVKTLSGTAEYVAPEALAQMEDGSRSYGKAYDWWSLGIVIYEMLVGESPFYDKNEHKMLRKIAYSEVVFPGDFPREAIDLVRGLLNKDPSRRLGSERVGGVDAIKSSRFFHGVDWAKLERRELPAYWKPKLTSETDTRYVDPEFIDDGPPSAVMDPSAGHKNSHSRRFSQFSFNINLQ